MSTLTLTNVPTSLWKKLWHKVDFSKIIWIHYDGMDWCQYDEVIPNKEDIEAYKNNSDKWVEAFSFLNTLK